MSDREWHFYIEDMITFAQNVMKYSNGFNLETFAATGLNYDATLRNLELIGEAATHLPVSIRKQHTAIPWRLIIATRNRLIHAYLGIDNDTLWSIIKDDVPDLLNELNKLKANL